MNKLEKELEIKRQRLKDDIEVYNFYDQIIDPILAAIPEELLEDTSLISVYGTKASRERLVMNVAVWLPYNPKLITKAKQYLEDIGCINIKEYDSWNKADLNLDAEKYVNEENRIDFGFLFRADSKASTCVLVPLKQKVKKEIQVQLYDRVCPESHPDLFEKDGEGNYVYVGDNLFPALKEEE